MDKKSFDVSWIIGILFSIIAVLISIYTSPKEISPEYITIGIILFMISIGIIIVVKVLSNIKNKLEEIDKITNKNSRKVDDFNKRFKTLEELNNIRLDIKELKREVFKK